MAKKTVAGKSADDSGFDPGTKAAMPLAGSTYTGPAVQAGPMETRNAPGTQRRPSSGNADKVARNDARVAIAGAVQVPGSRAQIDARATIKKLLDSYGLGELDGMSWGLITSGASEAEIWRNIEGSTPYKTRFKGLIEWNAKGVGPAQSVDQYLNFETQGAAYMRMAGLPPSFYDDPTDFANLFAGGVSLNELNQRVVNGYQAAAEADPEVKAQLRDLYGVTDGQLAAFFLDPNRALPAIERAVTASKIAAEGIRTGFGQLSMAEAENLSALGVTQDAAAQGFNQLAGSQELFAALPGQDTDTISRDQQLGAAFGNDVDAQQAISRRQRGRLAAQQSGGGAVTSSTGATGLGSAAS